MGASRAVLAGVVAILLVGCTADRDVDVARPRAQDSSTPTPSPTASATSAANEDGNGVDHVGNPTSWRADELTTLSAADEAVRLTYRSAGVVSTVVTVVRVERSVFYVDRRDDHTDGVRADERTVEAFVPTLAKAFG